MTANYEEQFNIIVSVMLPISIIFFLCVICSMIIYVSHCNNLIFTRRFDDSFSFYVQIEKEVEEKTEAKPLASEMGNNKSAASKLPPSPKMLKESPASQYEFEKSEIINKGQDASPKSRRQESPKSIKSTTDEETFKNKLKENEDVSKKSDKSDKKKEGEEKENGKSVAELKESPRSAKSTEQFVEPHPSLLYASTASTSTFKTIPKVVIEKLDQDQSSMTKLLRKLEVKAKILNQELDEIKEREELLQKAEEEGPKYDSPNIASTRSKAGDDKPKRRFTDNELFGDNRDESVVQEEDDEDKDIESTKSKGEKQKKHDEALGKMQQLRSSHHQSDHKHFDKINLFSPPSYNQPDYNPPSPSETTHKSTESKKEKDADIGEDIPIFEDDFDDAKKEVRSKHSKKKPNKVKEKGLELDDDNNEFVDEPKDDDSFKSTEEPKKRLTEKDLLNEREDDKHRRLSVYRKNM